MEKSLRLLYNVIDTRMSMSDKKPMIPKYAFRGQESRLPSVESGIGNAAAKEPMMYSGTKMIGIAQTHKSNAVPVFSSDSIIEISHMRR